MQPIVLDIKPIGKPRMTIGDRRRKGKTPRPAISRYWQFKEDLQSMVTVPEWGPEDALSLTFIIPMPDSWSEKKKRAMDGQLHTAKPDTDNMIKAVKDCLFEDDSVVHTYGPMQKLWGRSGQIIIVPVQRQQLEGLLPVYQAHTVQTH